MIDEMHRLPRIGIPCLPVLIMFDFILQHRVDALKYLITKSFDVRGSELGLIQERIPGG